MESSWSVTRITAAGRKRLRRIIRRTDDAGIRCRALVLLHYAEGKTTHEIAHAVHYDRSGVKKIRARFERMGFDALEDARRFNGQPKVDDDLLEALRQLLAKHPEDLGWSRTTWTQELLALALTEMTGVDLSARTVCRMLQRLGARHGMPKPFVSCPWPSARRKRRFREIRDLVATCPTNEVVLYSDEVDIHLNPRIGRTWMLPREQAWVRTPGQNEKCYLAGALDARTGAVHWAGQERKNSHLFIALLRELSTAYPRARRIHVILDNYVIHKSAVTQRALAEPWAQRIALHFLPPYCPDENRIERLWRELHANVTRNHRCRTMPELIDKVVHFMKHVAPFPGTRVSTLRIAA